MKGKNEVVRQALPDYCGARTEYRPVLSTEEATLCAGDDNMGLRGPWP